MRRGMALLVGALLIAPAAASAQSGYWWVGAGGLVPSGDYANGVQTGWMGTAGVGFDISSVKGMSVQGEFFYGSNSVKSPGTGSVSQTGGFVNLEYEFNQDQAWHPYVYGGYGIISGKYSGGGSSSSKGAFDVAGGLSYKYSPKLNVWAEARYISVSTSPSNTTTIPITIGISMPFGK